VGFADPVNPRVFPYLIGTGMVVLSVLLALATARGDLPQAEEREDVDLTTPADWVTVAKLVGILVLNLLLVNLLGWAITGSLLFAGAAWGLWAAGRRFATCSSVACSPWAAGTSSTGLACRSPPASLRDPVRPPWTP